MVNKAIMAVMLVLTLVATIMAADYVEVYPDHKYGALDAISSADAAPLDSSDYSGRVIILDRHPKSITVDALFSNAAATATVGVIRGRWDGTTFRATPSGTWQVFTAGSTYKIGASYVSKSLDFDTANWDACFFYVQAVSAGSVTVSWSVH